MDWKLPPALGAHAGSGGNAGVEMGLEAPSPSFSLAATSQGTGMVAHPGSSNGDAGDRAMNLTLGSSLEAAASMARAGLKPGYGEGAYYPQAPLATAWSPDAHPLCHALLMTPSGMTGRVEAHRRRQAGRGEGNEWGSSPGVIDEFLIGLSDGSQGVLPESVIQTCIERLEAHTAENQAQLQTLRERNAEGENGAGRGGSGVGEGAWEGGGGGQGGGQGPGTAKAMTKRAQKAQGQQRRETGGGKKGGRAGGTGVTGAPVERLCVPLPRAPAGKASLTPEERRRCLEFVRRLASPYFARDFCYPVSELHPEVWEEVRREYGFIGLFGKEVLRHFPEFVGTVSFGGQYYMSLYACVLLWGAVRCVEVMEESMACLRPARKAEDRTLFLVVWSAKRVTFQAEEDRRPLHYSCGFSPRCRAPLSDGVSPRLRPSGVSRIIPLSLPTHNHTPFPSHSVPTRRSPPHGPGHRAP